jgi:hypothetical protein
VVSTQSTTRYGNRIFFFFFFFGVISHQFFFFCEIHIDRAEKKLQDYNPERL